MYEFVIERAQFWIRSVAFFSEHWTDDESVRAVTESFKSIFIWLKVRGLSYHKLLRWIEFDSYGFMVDEIIYRDLR